jgi:holin-like protein
MGEVLKKLLDIPIPGNVIGMVILLAALLSGILKVEQIEAVSEFMLKYLAFFFVPAGIGIISSFDIISANFLPMLAVILLSTIIVLVVTGVTVQLLKRGKTE